jgi:hypothetical protein
MPLEQIGNLEQEHLPFIGLETRPWPFEGFTSSGHCDVDVVLVAARHGGEQFPGRRVAGFEGVAGLGGEPNAAHEHTPVPAIQPEVKLT